MIGTGTTWGLSGPTFLWLYAGLCIVVAVAVRWQWQRALGPKPTFESAELDPYRLAMLHGGGSLAITIAAARLHDRGVLCEDESSGNLVVEGKLDPDADDLERAVFDAVERDPEIPGSLLAYQLSDSEPVERLKSRLQDAGLLLKPEALTKLRWLKLYGVALFVLAAARIWTGALNDAPIGYLALMAFAVAIVTVSLPRKRPWATARGHALLAGQRKRHSDLRNGGTGADMPLGVALFGGAALWAAEPAIASTLNVPREQAWSGYGGYGGGGCGGGWGGGADSGGGDSGGGGGCGGGCGGGS